MLTAAANAAREEGKATMPKALIIGSGIAGPVTAMALARAGIEPVVYDAHEAAPVDLGTYLTVAVNGMSALQAIGAHQAVCAAGFSTRSIAFHLGDGRCLAEVDIGAELDDGTTTHSLKRADLQRTLEEETRRRGVEIHHGKRLTGIEETGSHVRARFADGTAELGDVLLGCDGVHSATRHLIDPLAPGAEFTGLLNIGGFTRDVPVEITPGTYRMMFGKRGFFGFTVSPEREVWWFANVGSRTELPRSTPDDAGSRRWRERLTRVFAGDAGPAAEIIRHTRGPLVASNSYELPTVPTWHGERTALLGDAVHAASPAAGQGASIAMEDAVELAKCLRDLPGPRDAFHAFETLRRERVERVIAQGARASAFKSVGPIRRRVRDRKLPAILRGHAEGGEHSLAWIHAYRVDWESPVRPVAG